MKSNDEPDAVKSLRESWIAARHCIREIKAAVAVKRDHEILWDILTAYDQRNHDAPEGARAQGEGT